MTPRSLKPWRIGLAGYWTLLAVISHWPFLHLAADNNELMFGVDKWGHVLAYGLLTWMVLSARLFGGGAVRSAIASIALVIVYAIVDELTQHFVNRTVSWADGTASNIGIVLAAGLWGWRQRIMPETTDSQSDGASFVTHTRLVSLLTLASRGFGLVRDGALAFALGFGWVYDAFVVAFMIPNLFRRLFGEGALAAAFIPHYTKLHQADAPAGGRFAAWTARSLFVGLMCLAVLIALGMLAALKFDWLPDVRGVLTSGLTAITIWYMPLVCVVAILGAILQVHKRFGVPAAAPAVLNVCVIITALVMWTEGYCREAAACGVALAVMTAGVIQVLWSLWALRAAKVTVAWNTTRNQLRDDPHVRDTGKAMVRQWLPTTVGLAVFQLNVLADALIAMFFSGEKGAMLNLFGRQLEYPMQVGSVAVLGAAARLYEFPLGVFGIAVATAIFPALSRVADDRIAFTDLVRRGLRLTVYIGLPASIGLVLVRLPVARAIYGEAGNLTAQDAPRVAWVLLGYAPAVWAYSMNHVLMRTFYAQHNPITPMKVAVSMVALNVVLNLTLIWPLGAAGLAWSTAVCAMLQCVILLVLVRRYVQRPVDATVAGSWARTAVLTVIMGAAVWGALALVGADKLSRFSTVVVLTVIVVAGVIIVGVGSTILGMDEPRWLLSRRTNRT